ncbi:MalY/PatB family protein [Clostridium baratii]|uniref:cysteine-S-conjugate beta-lyase n=1 Tax=Clostridium baratii str. Sullivan TaxID=1415775 RepID=A0A0A7G031_9CLOT|nr:aminotransferase class I/II-fold pyridoxal phosphate-dependent enzyme [Clostridium baratii]AIY84535.1 aminotransferase class I and II family protein [Clostridium baratii str. Sullivan]MDU4912657.1 aminotransferase class I/II-fold pyridoxal phosphate-dependent enzyme [Clostridium baratii]CUP80304.1 PLP-dependent aminotransferase [Clostridium baratii]
MYNFEDILDRKNNGSKKWSKEYIKKRFKLEDTEEIYPLFIADMDFKLPEEIIEPVLDNIKSGDFGYFDVKNSFYNSVKEWYKEQYKCDIKKEWIVPSIGALTSMNLIVENIFDINDKILIFTPVYGPFKDVIKNNNMTLVCHKLFIKDNRYYIDFEKLESQLEDVRGIILCNPHNPSGRCWSKEELERLLSLCNKKNITIISDEVHGDLTLKNNKFISLAKYLDNQKNIIVISSPNKTFNIAGLNISTFLCSSKILRENLEDEFNKRKMHVNRLGCDFSTICYKNGYKWVEALKANLTENMELAIDIIKNTDIEIIEPEAGYLLWVKLPHINNIDDFIIELANNKKVLLETGSRFIENYEGFLRINIATSKEILKEAMLRLVNFYNSYNSKKI